ncbi:hypothetical protein C8J57DRAFT_1236784 [Mycena rebaudengoi]|nr:hypothetical protein C8J57DRAFT_1236784 [Mycena rebaudengoi]
MSIYARRGLHNVPTSGTADVMVDQKAGGGELTISADGGCQSLSGKLYRHQADGCRQAVLTRVGGSIPSRWQKTIWDSLQWIQICRLMKKTILGNEYDEFHSRKQAILSDDEKDCDDPDCTETGDLETITCSGLACTSKKKPTGAPGYCDGFCRENAGGRFGTNCFVLPDFGGKVEWKKILACPAYAENVLFRPELMAMTRGNLA